MAVDGLLNIRHAAVVDFNCVAIKDLMQQKHPKVHQQPAL